jgi:hypothetical protein
MEIFHEIQKTAPAQYEGMLQAMNMDSSPVQIDSSGNYLGSREVCFIYANTHLERAVDAKTVQIFDFELSSEKTEQETKQQKKTKRADVIVSSETATDELSAGETLSEEGSLEDNSEVAIETTES